MVVWRQLHGKPCTGGLEFLPRDLPKHEVDTAKLEFAASPEVVYAITKLPVVTPGNVREFLDLMKGYMDQIPLWQWFAGSGSLSACMAAAPFFEEVLFPVVLPLEHCRPSASVVASRS